MSPFFLLSCIHSFFCIFIISSIICLCSGFFFKSLFSSQLMGWCLCCQSNPYAFFLKSENKYAPCFFLFLCMFVMGFTSLKLMIIVIIHLYTFLIFSSAFYIWITLNLLYSLLVGFSLCVCVVGIFEFYKHVFIVSIHNHYICKLNNLDRLNIGSWTKSNLSNCLCRFIR